MSWNTIPQMVLSTADRFGDAEPVGSTPEDLAKTARADFEKYARLISELNIRTN